MPLVQKARKRFEQVREEQTKAIMDEVMGNHMEQYEKAAKE